MPKAPKTAAQILAYARRSKDPVRTAEKWGLRAPAALIRRYVTLSKKGAPAAITWARNQLYGKKAVQLATAIRAGKKARGVLPHQARATVAAAPTLDAAARAVIRARPAARAADQYQVAHTVVLESAAEIRWVLESLGDGWDEVEAFYASLDQWGEEDDYSDLDIAPGVSSSSGAGATGIIAGIHLPDVLSRLSGAAISGPVKLTLRGIRR